VMKVVTNSTDDTHSVTVLNIVTNQRVTKT